MKTFNQFIEAKMGATHQSVGSLYQDLANQFPGQENRIKGILKDIIQAVIPNYTSKYYRPDSNYPQSNARNAKMGYRPPELTILTPEQYNLIQGKAMEYLRGK